MSISDQPSEPRPGMRIGDAERNLAADALSEHLSSGRLSLDEFTDRSDTVARARTRDQVEAVFADLPPTAAQLSVRPAAGPPPAHDRAVPARNNRRAVAMSIGAALPFIAVGLFFLLDTWVVFLLIPLWWAVIGPWFGRSGNDDNGSDPDRPRAVGG